MEDLSKQAQFDPSLFTKRGKLRQLLRGKSIIDLSDGIVIVESDEAVITPISAEALAQGAAAQHESFVEFHEALLRLEGDPEQKARTLDAFVGEWVPSREVNREVIG